MIKMRKIMFACLCLALTSLPLEETPACEHKAIGPLLIDPAARTALAGSIAESDTLRGKFEADRQRRAARKLAERKDRDQKILLQRLAVERAETLKTAAEFLTDHRVDTDGLKTEILQTMAQADPLGTRAAEIYIETKDGHRCEIIVANKIDPRYFREQTSDGEGAEIKPVGKYLIFYVASHDCIPELPPHIYPYPH